MPKGFVISLVFSALSCVKFVVPYISIGGFPMGIPRCPLAVVGALGHTLYLSGERITRSPSLHDGLLEHETI